jgi:hypothetical protein
MSAWLDPVRLALAADSSPVTFFFRDDDAGWEDEKLYRLLDVFTGSRVPVALAAIPMAVGPDVAAALRALLDSRASIISVHQHGFAHVNHELTGRSSEFGGSRPRVLQRHDLANGRDRLQDALGSALPPIFTPPWNRCTHDTIACLAELGFQVLSRDTGAEPRGGGALRELPVCLDWCGRRGARMGAARWGESIARAIVHRTRPTVGVMLHHAVMTADDRRMVRELLLVLERAPHATVRQLFDIARGYES